MSEPGRGPARPGDRIVRRARLRELLPVRIRTVVRRRVIVPSTTAALLIVGVGFAVLILLGTALLWLPAATAQEGRAPLLTALFAATSATCVTGLALVDTGTYWSSFGQSVLMVLMFLGGLGVMTSGAVILLAVGRRITLSDRLVLRDAVGASTLGDVTQLGKRIVVFAVAVQALGALVVFVALAGTFPAGRAAWYGLFHSVAAFNNAGLTNVPGADGFVGLRQNAAFLGALGVLIGVGGLSFPVLVDVWRHRRPNRWSLDTRLVIVGTVSLWALGAVAFFLLEMGNDRTIGTLPAGHQATNSIFQAISVRTAGFATADFGASHPGTGFIYMGLMFVGGASASTAGGIKINTAMVLVAASLASIRGLGRPEIFRRELTSAQVGRSLALLLLALMGLFGIIMALNVTEAPKMAAGTFEFFDVMFEAFSAFGTVGLSRGITAQVSDPGQVVLCIAMYVGRLGPLTFALGLALRERRAVYRLVQERVRIG